MKRITFIAIVFMLIVTASCNVSMSPQYQQDLEVNAKLINELNDMCQAGDPEACSQGLAKAARTVNLILNASYGR